MLDSLFKVRANWFTLIGFAILLLLLFPGLTLLTFIALTVTMFQFVLLFYSFGYVIPVRYLAGALMCIQMLVGPSMAYMGLDQYQYFKYKMQVSEYEYFSYAIPAVCAFIVGLNFNSQLKGEFLEIDAIKDYVPKHPRMIYIFIIGGFLSSVVSSFFGAEFGFIFYLLGSFKYIGIFLMVIGNLKLKPLPIIIVFGSAVVSSLGSTMFHDLITWLIFFLAVIAIKYKPSVPVKTAVASVFVMLVLIIQLTKGAYREATSYNSQDRNLDKFGEVLKTQEKSGTLFSTESLAHSSVRINQGFIVTHILNHIPREEPFANGEELVRILEAAFLPRFLAPNKLKAGDNSLVLKYSGIQLHEDTSMSLSSLGDGYINFGVAGGCIFMMVLGGFFNFILSMFGKLGKTYPIAVLFTPLAFYFPIRPDTALQTGLGHLVKASFLLYFILVIWKHQFKRVRKPVAVPAQEEEAEALPA